MSEIQLRRRATAPRDLLEVFAASDAQDRFYWERPDRGEAILGLGAAARIESRGESRFADAARGLRELRDLLRGEGDAPPWAGPLLVGGFAFDSAGPASERWAGLPCAQLVLPERLAVRRGDEMWCCRAGIGPVPDPGAGLPTASGSPPAGAATDDGAPAFLASSDRALGGYRGLVEKALGAIRDGELEKVVVARSCTVVGSRPFEIARVLRSLRSLHPSCVIFALVRGPLAFLGATPERLVRLEAGLVQVDAVAGSAARGRSFEEDVRLARGLLESKKDQEEHAVVVRCILDALARRCSALSAPESPDLLRTEGIQHLRTPILGRLRDPSNVLDLVADLHPTPAVGGAPREDALAWLRCNEGLDRGWYAGPVGWVDPRGEGEFAVALRSLLLRGREANLFAGAGIVAGSDPEAELIETRLKLRAALTALLEI